MRDRLMITMEKDTKRMDRSEIIAELEQVGGVNTRGNTIKCPYHDDHNPSGGIFQGDDGAWRFKCQTCGVHGDVFDLWKMRTRSHQSQQAFRQGKNNKKRTIA